MAGFLAIAEKKEFDGLGGSRPRRRDAPARLVLHTTETKTLPEYSSPPHFTVAVGHPGSMPSLKDGEIKILQHVSLDKTAFALLHPKGTEETNHMGSRCIQIEMVTYVGDQPKAHIVGNRGHLPLPLMEAVAGVVREILMVAPEIDPLVTPPVERWSASNSFGAKAKQRMTDEEWRTFNGICGHEHVPANAHWDPGEFDIRGFVGLVIGDKAMELRVPNGVASAVPTPVADAGWPHVLKLGDRSHKVIVVRGLLQALGYGDLGDTDLYNAEVKSAVEKLQADAEIRIDGKWGPDSHRVALAMLDTQTARADVDDTT